MKIFNLSKVFCIVVVAVLLFGACKQDSSHSNKDIERLQLKIEECKNRDDNNRIIVLADSIENIARKNKLQEFIWYAYSEKSTAFAGLHKIREGLFYNFFLIKHLDYSNKKHAQFLYQSYLNLSYIYKNLGKDLVAYNYISKAIEQSEESEDLKSQARIYNEAGLILYRQKNYVEAKYNFSKSLSKVNDIVKYEKILFLKQQLYSNLGLCEHKLKNYDRAISYFDTALQVVSKIKPDVPEAKIYPEIAKGVLYGNMGKVFLDKNEYEKGLKYLKMNLEINSKNGYAQEHANFSALDLLDFYIAKDSLKKVESIFSKQDFFNYRKANQEQIATYNFLKSKWLKKKSDFKNASIYLVKYINIKDSLEKRRSNLDFSHFIFTKKLEQLDHKLNSAKTEILIEEKRAIKFSLLFLVSLALLIVSVISAISFKRNTRKLKLLNKRISSTNKRFEIVNKKQKELIIEKNQILSVVAHDLSSPVAGIQGLTDILKENTIKFPGEKKDENNKIFSYIESSIIHLKEVISDLIEMASIEKEKGMILKAEIDIGFVLSKILAIHQNNISRKHIKLKTNLSAPKIILKANVEKLSRVLNNLITNAIKFSHVGGIIFINILEEKEFVIIEVKDEGIGIELEKQKIIFDRFTSAKKVGTDGERSVGLGLSIVKKIVELHSGSIKLESYPGRGSSFKIILPK
jgi:signal transduction histidine kinase/Tfp pilus assembly protein PilF